MKNFRVWVEDDIQKIESNLSNLISAENDLLKDLEMFLAKNSKRIRSLVVLLYLKINRVRINDNIIKLLTAGEIIHNASILHDDVIDDADLRRGLATISKRYDSNISILCGDYLLSYAVDYLNKLENKDILNIFINITKNMCKAEISQYVSRNSAITIEEYLNIIYGKTASLFEGILKSSAILAGIDSVKAASFGKLFGLLFQINNDMSDDSMKNDKKNGIKTVVDIIGIEKTNALKDNYKEEMRDILKEFPDSEYNKVLKELISLL